MDAGIWVDEGLQFKLSLLTDQVAIPSPLYLLLDDTPAFVPTSNMVVTDLSQPAWSGYAPMPVTSWAAPGAPVLGVVDCEGNNTVFSNTSGSPQTVYGWGLATGPGPSDTLLMVGAFSAPQVIPDSGVLVLTPHLQDESV